MPDVESRAMTLEGQIVRLADIIAYVSHDLDDAIRGEIIRPEELPKEISAVVGTAHAERIGRMVSDLIGQSMAVGGASILLSAEMDEAIRALRAWLFERVYQVDAVHSDFEKASRMLRELFVFFVENEKDFASFGGRRLAEDPIEVSVADFIAGMTDRFALALYSQIFLPQPWKPL